MRRFLLCLREASRGESAREPLELKGTFERRHRNVRVELGRAERARALSVGPRRCRSPGIVLREPGFLRPSHRPLHEVQSNVFVLRPAFLSHRLNRNSRFAKLQASVLGQQIVRAARRLDLKDPVFFYPHGEYCRSLAAEMKSRGFDLVHICMDYELLAQLEHVRLSHITLAIPEAAFLELRGSFGAKIPEDHWRAGPQAFAPDVVCDCWGNCLAPALSSPERCSFMFDTKGAHGVCLENGFDWHSGMESAPVFRALGHSLPHIYKIGTLDHNPRRH
jgi:hypothetical protein